MLRWPSPQGTAVAATIVNDYAAKSDRAPRTGAVRQKAERQRGVINLGKAAELLGLNYAAFFDLLGHKGLSPINASPEDLDESYRRFAELMDKQ